MCILTLKSRFSHCLACLNSLTWKNSTPKMLACVASEGLGVYCEGNCGKGNEKKEQKYTRRRKIIQCGWIFPKMSDLQVGMSIYNNL